MCIRDSFNTDGLSLESHGAEVYRQFQGIIEGSVELHVGETDDFSIHFLDSDGNEITIDESNIDCYPLSFEISDSSIISIEMEGEDHDDHDHGDDHGDEHGDEHGEHDACDECMESCVSYVMANYGYTSEQGTEWCSSTPNSSFGCADDCAGEGHDDHDHGDEEHCEDFATEADCGMHSECEWHADDSACEDAEGDHDEHGDEHNDHDACDECMDSCISYVMANYGYTQIEGNAWCSSWPSTTGGCSDICDEHEDEHGVLSFELTGLSAGVTTFQVSIMHQGHADYTSMPILVNVVDEHSTCIAGDINADEQVNILAVSYTHLTLPTKA